jgi:HNH endonuclease
MGAVDREYRKWLACRKVGDFVDVYASGEHTDERGDFGCISRHDSGFWFVKTDDWGNFFVSVLTGQVSGQPEWTCHIIRPFTGPDGLGKIRHPISSALRAMVTERDEGICALCLRPVHPEEAELDHAVPFRYGGATTLGNLRLTHGSCNRSRTSESDELNKAVRRKWGICPADLRWLSDYELGAA